MRVLSLGAGVQSSTLALMAAHGELEMPDCAIFADVQSEPQSVYDWLDWLEKQLPFPVYRVTRGNLAEEAVIVHTSKNGNKYTQFSPPAFMYDEETGESGIMMRQCTSAFKIQVIIKKLRQLGGKKEGVEQWIGISMDEIQRMKPARDEWITNKFPLIEKRLTRFQCFEWLISHGFKIPPKSRCYFCPYQSAKEWLELKNNEPTYFGKAIQFEKAFQKATFEKNPEFRGNVYINAWHKPLDTIDFEAELNSKQVDLFNNECEGICGV